MFPHSNRLDHPEELVALPENSSESIPPAKAAVTTGDAPNQGGDLIDNVRGNPEFTKWWMRWVSRVQRMGARRNFPARGRSRIERPEESRSTSRRTARSSSMDCEFKRYL